MAYDSNSPAQAHNALSDIDTIRNNSNTLRGNEANTSTAPPANPVPFQFWSTTDTKNTYQRNGTNSIWQYLWGENDLPVTASTLGSHTGTNITSTVSAHGIKQGAGNGFDADTVDGLHASSFVASSHAQATSNTHGAGSGVLLSAPTTTPFLIVASTAPTGWTQLLTYNDRVLRLVNTVGGGYGGSASITAAHAHNYTGVVAHTHTITDPGHLHTLGKYDSVTGSTIYGTIYNYMANAGVVPTDTATTGITINSTGSATCTTANSAVTSYVDVIACTKNP